MRHRQDGTVGDGRRSPPDASCPSLHSAGRVRWSSTPPSILHSHPLSFHPYIECGIISVFLAFLTMQTPSHSPSADTCGQNSATFLTNLTPRHVLLMNFPNQSYFLPKGDATCHILTRNAVPQTLVIRRVWT